MKKEEEEKRNLGAGKGRKTTRKEGHFVCKTPKREKKKEQKKKRAKSKVVGLRRILSS